MATIHAWDALAFLETSLRNNQDTHYYAEYDIQSVLQSVPADVIIPRPSLQEGPINDKNRDTSDANVDRVSMCN